MNIGIDAHWGLLKKQFGLITKTNCNVLVKYKQIHFYKGGISWNNFSLLTRALLFISAYCQFGIFNKFRF